MLSAPLLSRADFINLGVVVNNAVYLKIKGNNTINKSDQIK